MYPELRVDEGLDAWTVAETWIMGTPHAAHLPAHYVDVTETFDRKIHALRAHESQTGHMDDLDVFVGNWLKINAERGGLPEGRLAESFLVMATA
jgi:LmbE family N-acetylglucosaminyl deacetylase